MGRYLKLNIYRYEDKEVKTAAHKRMYGIEVACKATSRKLMCGASTEAEGLALTVSHPMKVDVEYLAKDICDATTATETDVKLVWDAMSERIVKALSHGYRVELLPRSSSYYRWVGE